MLDLRASHRSRSASSAKTAVELLLCDDPREASRLASQIDGLNAERKKLTAVLFEEAARAAEVFADPERHPVRDAGLVDGRPGRRTRGPCVGDLGRAGH
jgi:single-stranded DNA-specific DHH superfamily exonuclease